MTSLTPYRSQIHQSKYSRWRDNDGRRETHDETVDRYIEFWRGRLSLSDAMWKRLGDAIKNHEIVPSMRCLMTAGKALEVDEVAGYNCFGGDTQVVTRKGLAPIHELVGEQELLTSAGWAAAPVRSFGVQDTVEAVFHYGSRTKRVRVTEDHDWVTDRGRVTTVDLRRGDQVPIVTADRIDTSHEDYVLGRTHGLIYGDGAAYHKKQRAWGYQIRVCSDQDDIEPLLAQYKNSSPPSYDGDNVFFVREPTVPMKDLPFDHESDEYVLGFFRGWFAADGHVGETGICSMLATDEAAEWAVRTLPRVGIHVSSTKNVGGQETNFGKRRANACHIHLQAETLVPEDILIARKRERLTANPKKTYWSFTEITPNSTRAEEVFCAIVDSTHDFVIDGAILTGNCSYLTMSRPEAFDEVMYLLMCGVGVGFSVEERYVNKLPAVPAFGQNGNGSDTDLSVIKVGDSKYGWAAALRKLIKGLYAGHVHAWNTSEVRPSGTPLKTFGGRASGPAPLDDLFRHVVYIFTRAQGRKLTDLEVHSIVTKIGDIVVVGGVRRSAEISLFDARSDRMSSAKSGEWWHNDPHFALANNSAVWEGGRPSPEHFLEVMTTLVKSKSGEPGIFNRDAAKRQAARTGRRDVNHEFGCNPCGEIILRDRQLCNLTEVIARPDDTPEDLLRKVDLATILGTIQSTLTNFKHLSNQWQRNCEEERLLGVSITGIYDCPLLYTPGDDLSKLLNDLKSKAVDTNKKCAAKFNIPQSAAITCVKPSGNTSQLVGSASGIHPRHAKYIIRRNRGSKNDPVSRFLADSGVPHEDEVLHPDTTWVFSWPQRAPEQAITREDVTAIQQLELWLAYHEEWCEHKPSITVTVRDDEWPDVIAWVWRHWEMMSGVAFLPFDDHTYVQAPYEAITEEELVALEAKIPVLHWELLRTYEHEDRTEGHRELACVAGACEV